MAKKNTDKIYSLSGIDSFMLALEKHHKSNKTSSNICRYVIDLDGVLSPTRLESELKENEIVMWLCKLYVSEFLTKKKWERHNNALISVNEFDETKEYISDAILANPIDKSIAPLLRFDIQKLKESKSRLIMSWHHLLMDGHGAVLLLKSLGNILGDLSSEGYDTIQDKKSLKKALKAKFFLSSTSKGAISDGFDINKEKGNSKLEIINFSEKDCTSIKENALSCGAIYGPSTFFLSCVSITMKNLLARRGRKKVNFWLPVPNDRRKKGANSPILGNHLSFLFYRIHHQSMVDLKSLVKSLNEQMIHQIKAEMPSSYDSLMYFIKKTPSNLYYHWIKGPKGKSLSSFLFTVAAKHPESLKELFGLKITNAISLPPNTYPPGITFAFNTFEQQQHLAILYYDNIFNSEEIKVLISSIKTLLIEKN